MFRTICVSIALLFLPLLASAQTSWSTYDWRSGNQYFIRQGQNGSTYINGYNLNTGSWWRTEIDRRGNMSGWDSNNNYWNYNRGTGTYYNFGTGRMCTGTGEFRTCF